MWARDVEFMLACWLVASPFVFGHGADDTFLWAHDLAVAAVVASLALLSYWRPTRYAHLGIVLVALWLIGYGRFAQGSPPPPALQNHMVIGMLLLMFAIVPNRAGEPPEAWYRDKPVRV